jgi:superfamily I DNA/RNA helicase
VSQPCDSVAAARIEPILQPPRLRAAEPAKVLLETVRRFKGLERPVIVLTGIDELPAAEEQALLYVGLSRARVHLVIVATEKTMERVGGGER